MKLFFVIFVFIVSSCGFLRKAYDSKPARLTYGMVEKPIFSPNKQDSIVSSIDFVFYTSLDSAYKRNINEAIQSFTSEISGCKKAIEEHLTETYFTDVINQFERDYQEESINSHLIWSIDLSFGINDKFRQFAQLNLLGWVYTGGAHGNGVNRIMYFNKSTGEEIKINDFFLNLDELNKLGEFYFRKSREIDAKVDLNEAGYWFDDGRFYLPDNFYREKDNIVFFYNQYEIAPYSEGVIELIIPIEKLQPYMVYNFE